MSKNKILKTFIENIKSKLEDERILLSKNKLAIAKKNFRALQACSFAEFFLLATMVVLVNTVCTSLRGLTRTYSIGMMFGLFSYIFTRSFIKNRVIYSIYANYIFYIITLAIFTYETLFLESCPVSPVPYCIAIITFSVFTIDSSFRVYLFISITTSIFFIANNILSNIPSLHDHNILSISASSILACIFSTTARIANIKNINSERILKEERNIDVLTTLPNRRTLFEAIIASENGLTSSPFTGAIMLDIDNFKLFNDTYGHQKGDSVLKQIGIFLKDFAFDFNVSAYRYGGEEFLVLTNKLTEDDLKIIAERIVEFATYLNIPFPASVYKKVTFSAGYAVVSQQDNIHYEALISRADEALYHAKKNGRNRAICYSKEFQTTSTEKNNHLKKSFK